MDDLNFGSKWKWAAIKVIPKMDGKENMKVAGQILKLNKRDHKLPFGQ